MKLRKMKEHELFIPVEAVGIRFRNPFIVGSGPVTKNAEQLIHAEKAGWGGVSIKLTMDPEPYLNQSPRYRWFEKSGYHIFTSEQRLTLKEGLHLVEEGRRCTKEIIIFANIAYFGENGLAGWENMAIGMENAGAHAIELNFCCPNMSFSQEITGINTDDSPRSGASLGSNPELIGAIVRTVSDKVKIPIFAKIANEGGDINRIAMVCIDNGADGITSGGIRIGVPPFNIDSIDENTYHLQKGFSLGCISGPWVKPLAQRDVFQLRKTVGPDPVIIGMGGIRNHVDAIEMTMLGADLIGICTEVMLKGFDILPTLIKGIKDYMGQMGFKSFSEVRDKMISRIQSASELKSLNGRAKVDEVLCKGCARCIEIGHCDAIELKEGKAYIWAERCLACSTCVDICSAKAICMENL